MFGNPASVTGRSKRLYRGRGGRKREKRKVGQGERKSGVVQSKGNGQPYKPNPVFSPQE